MNALKKTLRFIAVGFLECIMFVLELFLPEGFREEQEKKSKVSTKNHGSRETKPQADIYPFQKLASVLSFAELCFYDVLVEAVGSAGTVLTKVRMADFMQVEPGFRNWQSQFNRINSKHVDFLLCKTVNMEPVLAIELDDSTHQTEKAKKNDNFKNEAYAAARLPLLRIKASRAYDKKEIRQKIQHAVKSTQTS